MNRKDLFDQIQAIQVSILCPQPYWLGFDIITEVSKITSMFEFPFSIDAEGIPFSEYNQYDVGTVINHSEVETGMVIDICFTDDCTVTNPRIYNADTGEYFGLTGTFTRAENIVYRIDSVKKMVTKLVDGEMESNLLNSVMSNSTWLMVRNGQNMFYYRDNTGTDDMYLKISFTEKYEGV